MKIHVDRMVEDRLPKKIMKYRPFGRRALARPCKMTQTGTGDIS